MKRIDFVLILFGLMLCGFFVLAPYIETATKKTERFLGVALPVDAVEIRSKYNHGFKGDDFFYIRFKVPINSFSSYIDSICETGEESLINDYPNARYALQSWPDWFIPDSEQVIKGGICFQNTHNAQIEILVIETDPSDDFYTIHIWGGRT